MIKSKTVLAHGRAIVMVSGDHLSASLSIRVPLQDGYGSTQTLEADLLRDQVRELRDHLTDLLGDA